MTFLFGDAFPLLFRTLTLNFAFLFSLNVRSLVSISDFIVTVLDVDSVVFGFVMVMEYVPGFESIGSVAIPLEFVLTEYVLPSSLNLTAVFLSSFPFLS